VLLKPRKKTISNFKKVGHENQIVRLNNRSTRHHGYIEPGLATLIISKKWINHWVL